MPRPKPPGFTRSDIIGTTVKNVKTTYISISEDRVRLIYRNHRDVKLEWAKCGAAASALVSCLGVWAGAEPKARPFLFPADVWILLWVLVGTGAFVATLWFAFRATLCAEGEENFVRALKEWSPDTVTSATSSITAQSTTPTSES